MNVLHRRYHVRPHRTGALWELHISGVGVATTVDLRDAPETAKAYITADLGPQALLDAEIVILEPEAHDPYAALAHR